MTTVTNNLSILMNSNEKYFNLLDFLYLIGVSGSC